MHFWGIEQRKNLVYHAKSAKKELGIKNASFIHGCFTKLNLLEFDHFYFFNSFYENLDGVDRIDDKIEHSELLYEYYLNHLYSELQQMPTGTKVVTYHSFHCEIPMGYEMVASHMNGNLNFWLKK